MLPHGPRPTTIARARSETPRTTKADERQRRSRRVESGVGEAKVVGPDAAARRLARRRTSRSRRRRRPAGPPARGPGSRPSAVGQHHGMPDVRREPEGDEDDADARRGSRTRTSSDIRGLAQAAAAPPGFGAGGGSDRDGPRLDLQDETAVGAGVDDREATEAAHRADDGELVLAGVAAAGAAARRSARRAGSAGARPGRPARRPRRSRRRRGPSSNDTLARGLRAR